MSNRRTPTTDLFAAWTIAEILARWPRAATAFTRSRMACVGCPMAAFETPAEAARAYGLDPATVLAALEGVVRQRTYRLLKERDSMGSAGGMETRT